MEQWPVPCDRRSREERRMRALDEKIDIYALGGVLYRLMAGPGWTDPHRPAPHGAQAKDADGASTPAVAPGFIRATAVASDGTPSWARCGASPWQGVALSRACRLVSSLVARCWAHEPADRPAADEVVERLEAVLHVIQNGGDDGEKRRTEARLGAGLGGVGKDTAHGTTDPYHHNGGDGGDGSACLSEECGNVACPVAVPTVGSQLTDSPPVKIEGHAVSLVADVRACAKAGAACPDLPRERRRRQRAELLSSAGGSYYSDADQELAAAVRRVRVRQEGVGLGAGTHHVDLGKAASGKGAGGSERSGYSGVDSGVSAGGLSIVDLDTIVGQLTPVGVGGTGGSVAAGDAGAAWSDPDTLSSY